MSIGEGRLATYVPGGGWVSDQEWSRRQAAGREAGRRNPEQARRMLAGQQRALSVRRPWANLIIAGHKTVENRTWAPQHRSVVVVHAGRAWEPAGAAAAAALGLTRFDEPGSCPTGYLGTVRLVGVHPAAGCCAPWGEQDAGVFHWVLADAEPFAEPVPGPGRLGLYWVGPDILTRPEP